MSYLNETLEVGNSLYRFNPESTTCYGSDFDDVLTGFSAQFGESDCYTFVIQFIIVALMYTNIGRGKYWLLLFLASIAGVCGAFIENGTLAFICQKKYDNINGKFDYIPTFLLNEIFWIFNEFSIPILNLIKMQAFSKESLAKWIKRIIIVLFIPFIGFRLAIGYTRMMRGYLLDSRIRALHAGAFTVMAIADILCTISILHFVRKSKSEREILNRANDIKNHVKRSSYTTLIVVDIACVFLCVLEFITNTESMGNILSSNYVIPFRCIKDSFALILATDALIFKYEVNIDSSSGSNGYSGRNDSYGYSKNNSSYQKNNSSFQKNNSSFQKSNNSYHQNNNSSYHQKRNSSNYKYSISNEKNLSLNKNSLGRNKYNEPLASVTPYNYPTFDMDMYSKSPGRNKSIIKNYSNIKPSNMMDESDIGNKGYDINYTPNQNFGFLNKN